ncbi:hypothetical protein [Saccharothrix lopnurensis]|uniref:Uncharacterized protein n=1 Tax=Saccharothrix lopnurensis TaxID=1670621 RepID=A0ABW1PHB2_9PSEU
MSAWTVENGHIDVLVNAMVQLGIVPKDLGVDGFRTLGQKLWDENHASVNHLYDEDTSTPRYRLHTTEADLDPILTLRAADCYTYQSCEHPGWKNSEAHALTRRLREAILDSRPEFAEVVRTSIGPLHRYTTLSAYQRAPWGFDSLDQAVPTKSR